MDTNTTEIKYPFDIISEYSQNKTFSIAANFTFNDNEDHPLHVFNSYSRYGMCVIEDSKAVICNIPLDLVASIEKKTENALRKHLDWEWAPKASGGSSPAYTTRFLMGELKGKTPAEVLAEDYEKGKEKLNAQYVFLKENLEKYPKNKELMDAIVDSANINPDEVTNQPSQIAPMTILNIGTRPLRSKIREEDGKWLCYEVNISWTPTNNYPVAVCITNYYAPVVKDERTKLLNVQLKGKDTSSEISNTFYMSVDAWLNVVDTMVEEKKEFNRMYKATAYKRAIQANKDNKERAKNK